ncbi:hypothetical protein GCM10023311_03840 [Flaviramulus aquimarinus]|uniref:HTH luxR-type domain-containing protein n=1 Tax=Flaviramulus aquimarinus TaxID=1170456 RepID=A0ABP9EQ96_9FLAO
MKDKEYLFHLYEIVRHLNKEFSLSSALRKSLEKTVEVLDLETGWIWMAEKDLKSVYLAASFNLPPALRDYPERLSGWCYCIDRYFSGNIEEAVNISEISCSRLNDLTSGTRDLKFHATIPIITNGQKVGLINLLSKEKRQLDAKQLSILNTISELIGIAIHRTRLQETYAKEEIGSNDAIRDVLKRLVEVRIEELLVMLYESKSYAKADKALDSIIGALKKAEELKEQVALMLSETLLEVDYKTNGKEFRYPTSPLTQRELEVLTLVKKGHTNGQIAEQLYISLSTVKFHITSILSKLNAKTRTQAVDIALKRGIVTG